MSLARPAKNLSPKKLLAVLFFTVFICGYIGLFFVVVAVAAGKK
jgi:hypothetical protein